MVSVMIVSNSVTTGLKWHMRGYFGFKNTKNINFMLRSITWFKNIKGEYC